MACVLSVLCADLMLPRLRRRTLRRRAADDDYLMQLDRLRQRVTEAFTLCTLRLLVATGSSTGSGLNFLTL